MINHRTLLDKECPEKSTYRITGTLVDETGAVIAAASLSTLTLTLYNLTTLAIVNSVTAVNILNTGRGTVGTAGEFVLTLLPADSPMVDTANDTETRVALVEWTYAAGAKAGKHEYVYDVRNLNKVT